MGTVNAVVRRARKRWRCDQCNGIIEPGDRYVDTQHVAFPGGEWVGGPASFHERKHAVCPAPTSDRSVG